MRHHTFFSIPSSSMRTCYSVQIWNTDRDFGPQLLFSNVKQWRLARVPCCSWCVEPKALTSIRYQLVNTHFHRSNLQMENALVKHAEARTKHTHRSSGDGSVIWRMSSLIFRVVYTPDSTQITATSRWFRVWDKGLGSHVDTSGCRTAGKHKGWSQSCSCLILGQENIFWILGFPRSILPPCMSSNPSETGEGWARA